MLLGRKGRCGGTHFVRTDQIGHLLVESLNPLVDGCHLSSTVLISASPEADPYRRISVAHQCGVVSVVDAPSARC